jgi:hypothetical protein
LSNSFIAEKGQGAWYAHSIIKLGETRELILEVLKEQYPKWMTSWHLAYLINKKRKEKQQKNLAFGTVSGRLSELLGLGYVEMSNEEIELYDSELMSFGWPEKPTWKISQKGIRYLEAYSESNEPSIKGNNGITAL